MSVTTSPHSPVVAEVRNSTEGTHNGEKQYDLEKADESRDASSTPSICPSEQRAVEKTIIHFEDDDPLNPYNWKRPKKLYIVIVSMAMVMNSTIGSSIASGATQETKRYFGVKSDAQMVLPVSIYLIGYVIGPLVFAVSLMSPLSFGIPTGSMLTHIAAALGIIWPQAGHDLHLRRLHRLHFGMCVGTDIRWPDSHALASRYRGVNTDVRHRRVRQLEDSPVLPATLADDHMHRIYADIYNTRKARGLVITLFMAATTWGPLIGPIASGYVSIVSWRWSYWVLLIIAGATWPFLLLMPETYGPIVLKHRAQQLRKETSDASIMAPIELQAFDMRNLLTVVLTRPIRMFFTEAIVLTSCLYLSVVYGIFYSTSPCASRSPLQKQDFR